MAPEGMRVHGAAQIFVGAAVELRRARAIRILGSEPEMPRGAARRGAHEALALVADRELRIRVARLRRLQRREAERSAERIFRGREACGRAREEVAERRARCACIRARADAVDARADLVRVEIPQREDAVAAVAADDRRARERAERIRERARDLADRRVVPDGLEGDGDRRFGADGSDDAKARRARVDRHGRNASRDRIEVGRDVRPAAERHAHPVDARRHVFEERDSRLRDRDGDRDAVGREQRRAARSRHGRVAADRDADSAVGVLRAERRRDGDECRDRGEGDREEARGGDVRQAHV